LLSFYYCYRFIIVIILLLSSFYYCYHFIIVIILLLLSFYYCYHFICYGIDIIFISILQHIHCTNDEELSINLIYNNVQLSCINMDLV